MKIICPQHQGTIYVPGNNFFKIDGDIKNLVVECPVCDEEVLITASFYFDSEDQMAPITNKPNKN